MRFLTQYFIIKDFKNHNPISRSSNVKLPLLILINCLNSFFFKIRFEHL